MLEIANNSSEENLRHISAEIQQDLTSTKRKYGIMQADYKELSKENTKLNDKTTCLEEDLERAEESNKKISDERNKLKKTMENNLEYEKELLESLARHINIENEMASKLVECKNRISEAQSFYKVFNVINTSSILSSDAKLILRKDNLGEIVFEINQARSKKIYKFTQITGVNRHHVKLNRFVMRFDDESEKEFETEDVDRVITTIREVLIRVLQN